MANHRSAKKRNRQTVKRTRVNHARLSRIRTFVKRVEHAISTGDQDAARAAFGMAEPELRRGANRGVLHRNTASRKISRLSRKIAALGAVAPA